MMNMLQVSPARFGEWQGTLVPSRFYNIHDYLRRSFPSSPNLQKEIHIVACKLYRDTIKPLRFTPKTLWVWAVRMTKHLS